MQVLKTFLKPLCKQRRAGANRNVAQQMQVLSSIPVRPKASEKKGARKRHHRRGRKVDEDAKMLHKSSSCGAHVANA